MVPLARYGSAGMPPSLEFKKLMRERAQEQTGYDGE
jgi:hypothetical protein